jgi:hypothetical protein
VSLADIGLLLADLAAGGELALDRLTRLVADIDRRHAHRKTLIGHIQAMLKEGDDPMFPIATRKVPARRVMSIQRRLHSHETDDLSGKPRQPSPRISAERVRLDRSASSFMARSTQRTTGLSRQRSAVPRTFKQATSSESAPSQPTTICDVAYPLGEAQAGDHL